MGCTGGPSYDEQREEFKKAQVEKGLMCAALTFIEQLGTFTFDEFLAKTDWNEIGFDKETAKKYWQKHKEADEIRREMERKEKEKIELIKSAAGKLSKEELKALGVTGLVTRHVPKGRAVKK